MRSSELVDEGIETGVAIAPVLPGISDRPEQLAEVVRRANEAGAAHVWPAFFTSGRERASTSSTTSPATGPSSSTSTGGSTAAVPIFRRGRHCRSEPRSRRLRAESGGSRRTVPRLRPERDPEQLAFALE